MPSAKWCLVDKGLDGIDLKYILGTTVKWYSATFGEPVTRIHQTTDGDKGSVMAEGSKGRGIRLPIAAYCGPEHCGELADRFSNLKNSMCLEEFLSKFQEIKDTTISDGVEIRKPLEALENKKSNKPSPVAGKSTQSVNLLRSPGKLFERTSRSLDKSPKIVRNISQRRKRLFSDASSSSTTELESSFCEPLEELVQDNQATVMKRQRVSLQQSKEKGRSKRRDFPHAVIAMREALTSNMGEEAYNELADDQLLPNPPDTVRTKWQEILGCQNYTQIIQNAREYRLVALLSKRCWNKVLWIFQLCKDNGIATEKRQATVLMFRPLRGLREREMYKVLSQYADTPIGTAKDVKTVIAEAEQELGKDSLSLPPMDQKEMKERLEAFQREGMTPEVAAKQRVEIRNLQAQVYQLRMFALDVALVANSHSSSETKMRHIEDLLEIGSFLDPDTGGFAAEISLSKVEGHPSLQSPSHLGFDPTLSSTRLHGDDDSEETFDGPLPLEEHFNPDASPEQHSKPATSPEQHSKPATSPEQHSKPATSPEQHSKPATSPEQHSKPATSPEQHSKPATSPEQHSKPATSPEQHSKPATSPEQHSKPATSPEQHSKPATSPEQHSKPATSPEQHSKPATSPEQHSKPATSPEQHSKPATSPEQHSKPATSLEQHSKPATSPEQHSKPATSPEQHSKPATSPEQHSKPATSPEQHSKPATSPEQHSKPATSPEQHSKPATSLEQHSKPATSPEQHSKPATSPEQHSKPATSPEQHSKPATSPEQHSKPATSPEQHSKGGWVAVALAYPEGWHIGKVEEVQEEKVVVSFLEPGPSGHYRWPVRQDLLHVYKRCILLQGVKLSCLGTGTRKYWTIPASVRSSLDIKFEDFRNTYWVDQ
ncbi:uncharacterized protein LOC144903084 [Branchiostoma floridae x Branchiostoma belcheri]